MDLKTCPECGEKMGFFFGSGWMYDAWYCTDCGHEIELDVSTSPEENEAERDENED